MACCNNKVIFKNKRSTGVILEKWEIEREKNPNRKDKNIFETQ